MQKKKRKSVSKDFTTSSLGEGYDRKYAYRSQNGIKVGSQEPAGDGKSNTC